MAVTLITEQELLKLATLSSIKLEEHEVEPLRASLQAVLTYASRLQDIAQQYQQSSTESSRNNIMRADVAVACTENMVEYATVHENNFFVVPMIIKQS